jgi:hypothetical protein
MQKYLRNILVIRNKLKIVFFLLFSLDYSEKRCNEYKGYFINYNNYSGKGVSE